MDEYIQLVKMFSGSATSPESQKAMLIFLIASGCIYILSLAALKWSKGRTEIQKDKTESELYTLLMKRIKDYEERDRQLTQKIDELRNDNSQLMKKLHHLESQLESIVACTCGSRLNIALGERQSE